MTVTIEKNVPMPEKGTYSKYPWKTMEVGDSFFVIVSESARSAMSSNAKRFGIRVMTRKEGDGVRVWRIE